MRWRVLLVMVFLTASAAAQEPQCQNTATSVCVDREDLRAFLRLAEERRCLDTTTPEFETQPVTVITDEEGRVFHTGSDPERPYRLKMRWCHYEVTGEGRVRLVAAMREPETWGFRFRPKAYLGYLPFKVFEDQEFGSGVDAGIMVDLFHWQWANVNAAVGFRSLGAGLGVDLTKNFGLYAGYAFSWSDPPNNVLGGFYFAF